MEKMYIIANLYVGKSYSNNQNLTTSLITWRGNVFFFLYNFHVGHVFERKHERREVFFVCVRNGEQLLCVAEVIK